MHKKLSISEKYGLQISYRCVKKFVTRYTKLSMSLLMYVEITVVRYAQRCSNFGEVCGVLYFDKLRNIYILLVWRVSERQGYL